MTTSTITSSTTIGEFLKKFKMEHHEADLLKKANIMDTLFEMYPFALKESTKGIEEMIINDDTDYDNLIEMSKASLTEAKITFKKILKHVAGDLPVTASVIENINDLPDEVILKLTKLKAGSSESYIAVALTAKEILMTHSNSKSSVKDLGNELASTKSFYMISELRPIGEELLKHAETMEDEKAPSSPDDISEKDAVEYLKGMHWNELLRLRDDRHQLAGGALPHEMLMKHECYAMTHKLDDAVIFEEITSRDEHKEILKKEKEEANTGTAPANPPFNTGPKKGKKK